MKYRDFLLISYCVLFHLGEACWWTVHPASKQRSEGEKVRVGDDLILVSVATERYLVSVRVHIESKKKKNNVAPQIKLKNFVSFFFYISTRRRKMIYPWLMHPFT